MKPEEPIPEKQKQKSTKNSLTDYAKYSSLAFEMIAVIMLGVFGGRYLDNKLSFDFPVLTLLFSFISIALAIYLAIKDVINSNKK